MDTENLEDFANKVANFLKTNGKFDEFRKKCASEIEQHVSFVKARKEVDELVRLRVVNNRKSQCPLTKNQLRHEIRTLLSKRKDLLAAADSSIQFSLRNNKELFATEINDVTAQFEEEEKAEAEAKKLEQAEKAVQESQEVDNAPVAEAAEVDIPPPPPPPPPPAPIAATTRPTAALPTISGTDTALLIQESVFHNDVLSGPSHSTASHTMNITDLLANVQSSDFAAQQVSPQPVEHEHETASYPTYHEPEPAREMSHSPKNVPADTIIIMSKQDVAKEIYNFEKEEKQFSHYIKEEEDYEKNKYPDEARDYKYGDHSRYDYPDYKRSSSSYKSRKHGEEYRERSSSSKHRERSLSPSKYSERYKEYSVRDYGHSMDRMFKSPEYYLSISRSSSSRSSTKESSRDRRKREEEWYQKYGYSSKYSHNMPYGSHKYSESSRRDEYYKEYYDKRRHDDPYYKSSERSKSRDYALYEASKGRESTHDPYKMRDAAYEISKIRQSTGSDSSKFKEPPYVPSKYHEHELMKSRERDLLYRDRIKEEAYNSNLDIRERRTHLDRPYENLGKYSPGDVKLKPPKMSSPVRSPLDNPPPLTPEKSHTPEEDPSPPRSLPDEEPSSSRNDLDDLLERAISNIPKTPEDPSPVSSVKDEAPSKEEPTGVVSESNIDHLARSPMKLPSPTKSLPKSPLKPIISEIEEDLTEFEMQVRDTKVNDSSRRALIESILPKPKYCSILKETYAVADGGSVERNDAEANDDFECKDIPFADEVKESIDALRNDPTTSNEITDFKQGTALNTDHESGPPVSLHGKIQPVEFRPTDFDDSEPEDSNDESLMRHDNQDFPVPSSPPLPPPPPAPPSVQHSSLLPPSLPKPPSLPMPHSLPILPSLPQAKPVSIAMTSTQPTAGRQSPHSPLSLQQAIAHQTTLGTPRGPISPPLRAPVTPPRPPPPPPPPPSSLASGKISNILGDIRKASPAKPIVLSTTRKKERVSKPNNSSDAEEGEILSDTDEPVIYQNPTFEDVQEKVNSQIQDPAVEDSDTNKDDEKINKENEVSDVHQSDSPPLPETVAKELTPRPPEPKVFVPDENFPIRSKRDLFKARFFQPDMKIDFAKPDQVTDNNPKPDSSVASEKEDSEKAAAPQVVEVKPNPDDNMRYSRKMRFKEVLQQHISEQENAKEQQLKESQQKDNIKEVAAPESGASSQQPVPAVEPDVSAVSLIGKRKRFLNDYIASLESNPPPAKSIKTEEASVEESLPKLRIKPLSGGSYSSEALSSAPPPLHKASTSPDKEAVPKCIIKLGKGHWNACETEKPETTGKRKGRAATRPNLRSREASTDSSKSEIAEKPRATRSKKSRKAVNSYNVEEDEKNSDNSFEEVDNSRRSGRTRKTIKRLNL